MFLSVKSIFSVKNNINEVTEYFVLPSFLRIGIGDNTIGFNHFPSINLNTDRLILIIHHNFVDRRIEQNFTTVSFYGIGHSFHDSTTTSMWIITTIHVVSHNSTMHRKSGPTWW